MEKTIQATGVFIVKKGLNLITKLAASKGELKFTRSAVGTGKPPEGYSPDSMIGLNSYKMDAEIADYGVQADMAYITVQVSSMNVDEGFLVSEVGVFAQDPDEGEILYGYMDISTDPTYIYANGSANRSKFAEFTLYVLIGNVANVTAAVTPGSIITKDTFTAENMKAIDTYGILGGNSGAETNGQKVFDALVNKVLTEVVTNSALTEKLGEYILKSKIVNDFLATDTETVLSGPAGKNLKGQLDKLSKKLTDEFVSNTALIEKLGAYVLKSKIVNNFLSTDAETVLSGPMGKELKGQLDVLNTKLSDWVKRQGIPLYSSDLLNTQGGGRLLYYDANTANTPYKAGVTQASEGVAITVGDWGSFITSLAIPKGGATLYLYSRSNGVTTDWKAIS